MLQLFIVSWWLVPGKMIIEIDVIDELWGALLLFLLLLFLADVLRDFHFKSAVS